MTTEAMVLVGFPQFPGLLELNEPGGGQDHSPHSDTQGEPGKYTAARPAACFRRFDELLEIFMEDRGFGSRHAGSRDWKRDLLSTHVAILVRKMWFCRAVFG